MKQRDKLTKFFDVLHTDDAADISEIRKDLDAASVNLNKIESSVSLLLSEARSSKKLDWLKVAKEKRLLIGDVFEKQSKEIKSKFSNVRDLVNAIKTGTFGIPLQQKANAFFRNQDFNSISDSDLASFVEDCQLLDSLEKNEGEDD